MEEVGAEVSRIEISRVELMGFQMLSLEQALGLVGLAKGLVGFTGSELGLLPYSNTKVHRCYQCVFTGVTNRRFCEVFLKRRGRSQKQLYH